MDPIAPMIAKRTSLEIATHVVRCLDNDARCQSARPKSSREAISA
jgi:hypothetical protein